VLKRLILAGALTRASVALIDLRGLSLRRPSRYRRNAPRCATWPNADSKEVEYTAPTLSTQENPMRLPLVGIVLIAGVVFASDSVRATPMRDPGECARDSKLIGRVSVFGDENETSWWNLTWNGMEDAGLFTDTAKTEYLSGVFGMPFASLEDAKDFNLQTVSDLFDKNGNGLVCAYELRGTRAYNTDPFFEFTVFGVSDDKIRK
jgi:hypothetical protein